MLRILALRRLSASAYPAFTKVTLPALSPTMTEGGLAKWRKQEGDSIKPGEVLCEIETDKATIDFEFQEDAILGKRLVPEKATGLKVGSVIALLIDNANDVPKFANATFEEFNTAVNKPPPPPATPPPKPQSAVVVSPPVFPTTPVAAQTQANREGQQQQQQRIFASPLAKKLAREMGRELESIQGSGPNGRILASDVQNAPKQVSSPTSATPISTAQQALSSWVMNKLTAPHYYLNMDIDFTQALSIRAKLNEEMGTPDAKKISVNDIILRAAVMSMKRVPEVNACWMDNSIRFFQTVDVNVTTAASGQNGVSCLVGLQQEGLAGIASKTLEEGREGTFSIVNAGAYGVKSIVPIVRPGQACALGVGVLQPVLVPDVKTGGAVVKTMATITLSCDHRIVDGAIGAQWLQCFKSLVEKPLTMLL
jgi:pyruvate dehydrogenase E2 component (dihydrolipoamide acetyltransferase)